MRKINMSWQSVLLSVALLGLAACTGDFEDINRNPNQVTEEQMDALNYKTGTKFKSLQSLVIPVQEHMYQFNESLSGGPFGGYIGATVDTWQTKFETYNPSADWRKWPFANVITETYTPYKGIVNGTEDEVAIAFARLLRVAIMHRVTDSYGPIPYSKLESNESVYVEYDSQEAVYTKMFEELDEAIEILGRNTTLPAEAWSRYDGVYYGNIAQWLKYANSLKLRMAMRLSYVKSDVARAKAAEAIAGGVIEANADNAAMHAAENRTTLIYNDWGDHRVGADILCYMNGYKDPRMEKMFLANDVGDYVGIRIGIDVTSFAGFDNKSVDPFGQAFEIYIDAPMLKIDAGRLAENRLDGTKLKAHPTIPGRFVYTVDAKRETERRYGTDDIANTDNIASSQRGERKTLPFLVNSVVSAGDIVISSDESRVVYYSKTFRVSNQSIAGTLQYKNTAGVVQNIPKDAFVSFERTRNGSRIGSVSVTADGQYELRLRKEYEFNWYTDEVELHYTGDGGMVYHATYPSLSSLFASPHIVLEPSAGEGDFPNRHMQRHRTFPHPAPF